MTTEGGPPPGDPRGDVTRILRDLGRGGPEATRALLPLVYDELRRMASARLASERPGGILQATALVHEAYLRLVGPGGGPAWEGRGHFFAAAAEAMRRIVVEDARASGRLKRGGGLVRVGLDPDRIASPEAPGEILALDESLTRLEAADPRAAEVVKLRFFAGLTVKQAAGALGVSPRTVDASWAYARAWLLADLRRGDGPPPEK